MLHARVLVLLLLVGGCPRSRVPDAVVDPLSDADRLAWLERQGARSVLGGAPRWGAVVRVPGFAVNTPFGPGIGRDGMLVYCEGTTPWDDAHEGRFMTVTGVLIRRPGHGGFLAHRVAVQGQDLEGFTRPRVGMVLESCSIELGFPLAEVPDGDAAGMAACPGFPRLPQPGEPDPQASILGVARQTQRWMMVECGGQYVLLRCPTQLRWPDETVGDEVVVEGTVFYRPPTVVPGEEGALPRSGLQGGRFGVLGCPRK